jgi:hypothetical protein
LSNVAWERVYGLEGGLSERRDLIVIGGAASGVDRASHSPDVANPARPE